MADVDRIVEECDRYWRGSGVPADAVAEMRAELHSHLVEAAAAGKTPDDVVGPDLAAFAETWARTYRGPVDLRRSETSSNPTGRRMAVALGLIVAGFVALAVWAPKEETMDFESWQWIWIGAAAVLAIGEMLTAGFFLLPFAVGAAAAGILAFLGVGPVVQLLTFIVVSVLFLVVLQRYARKDDAQVRVDAGAGRYVGSIALVLEPVDRHRGGLVRLGTEEWRATTDQPITIPADAEVRVVEVRGTRLVVEPIPPETD
ncbi:MAG TPA: hypothetical protein ENK55_11240 [Actinobacteria bacterium]|nr:hypothetical protein [Actinomycetota bacterium]